MKYREEYLKNGGIFCPFCKNQDIEGGSVEIIEGTAQQNVSCVACGGAWRDKYKLNAVETIEEPSQ